MITSSVQEFYSFFQFGKPIMSIDYGLRKIGFAISTPDLSYSMPYMNEVQGDDQKKIELAVKIISDKDICAIVIGWPVNMDGSKSSQTVIVENFAKILSESIKLPIFFQDERLTTRAADVALKELRLNRRARNNNDDAVSASMILETTLLAIAKLKRHPEPLH